MSALDTTGRIPGKFQRGSRISIIFDGQVIAAFEGESVAAALIASGVRATRSSPAGTPRGPFCLMGSCQECAVRINGVKVLACMTDVTDGLVIQSDRLNP